jgi:undecaprenyl-diphosphatase
VEKMAHADETLFLWINGLAGRVTLADSIMVVVGGDYLVPVSLALVLVGIWFVGGDKLSRQRYQTGVIAALTSLAFSNLTVLILNQVYVRPRPFVDLDVELILYRPTDLSSFPANSIAATFGLAAVVWGINRPLGSVLLTVTSLYAVSRVYAGVHYPLDVLVGALIGITVAFLVLKLRNLLEPLLVLVIKAARIFCLA